MVEGGRLAAALAGRRNALNFVRLILATAVIFWHSSIAGRGSLPVVGDASLGSLAVAGFFTISGYLIAGSRVRLTWWGFVWRRFLRIFPAFWVCLLVVALAFAPLSTLGTGRSWDPISSASYVVRNAALWIFQPSVADTLGPDRFPMWNGSLWTLTLEFPAYLVAGLILSVGVSRRRPVLVLGLVSVLLTTTHLLAVGPLNVTGQLYLNILELGGFFLGGMVIWSLAEYLPVSTTLGLIAGAAVMFLMAMDAFRLLGPLPLAYFCLWLGARLPVRIGMTNDVSYGMYIYAFPVEQILSMTGFFVGGLIGFSVVAALLTVPLAWLSWKFVEQPALALRHLVPGQRAPQAEVAATG